MNIWNIALKEIKSNLRNTRTFVFMLALPIVLMLILGPRSRTRSRTA